MIDELERIKFFRYLHFNYSFFTIYRGSFQIINGNMQYFDILIFSSQLARLKLSEYVDGTFQVLVKNLGPFKKIIKLGNQAVKHS